VIHYILPNFSFVFDPFVISSGAIPGKH